jgi:hypothetical protein
MFIGKKTANTGIRIVPGPDPEKIVRMAGKKAARQITKISMNRYLFHNIIHGNKVQNINFRSVLK